MAAAAADFGAYLVHLGFSARIRTQIMNQGYDSVEAFSLATKSDIDALCDNVRNTAVNANANPVVFHEITGVQQNLLLQIALYCKFIEMTDTAHTQANGALANLRRIYWYYSGLGKAKDVYKDIPDYPAVFDGKNSFGMLEDFDDWLGRAKGKGGTLLSYITRAYPDPDDNPVADAGFLTPSVEDYAIRHTSHTNDDFIANRKEVWTMVHKVCHNTTAWNIVKSFKRSKNGGSAIAALNNH